MKASLDHSNAKLLVYVAVGFLLVMVGVLAYKTYSSQSAIGNIEAVCEERGVGTHNVEYLKPDGTTGNRVVICNEDGSSQTL